MPEMPSVNVKAVARQVLKTWWFWLGLAVVVWGGLLGVEKLARIQTNRFQEELTRTASNQLAQSIMTISNAIRQEVTQSVSNQLSRELTNGMTDVSNQIAAALQQPKIQSAIQSAVAQQASQMMARSIAPAISNFQAKLAREQSLAEARVDGLTNIRPPPPAPAPTPTKEAAKASKPSTPDTPGQIVFDSQSVAQQGSIYAVTVRFRKTGTQPLGIMHFAVGAFNQLPGRIVGVDAATDAAIGVEKSIDNTGLEASVNFSTPDGADPAIQVLFSRRTVFQVVCDALQQPVTINLLTNQPAGQ